MKILALDLGTKMGYSLMEGDKLTESGTKIFKKPKDWPGQRYADYEQFISYYIREVDIIFYEDVKRHRGTIAAHVYGAFEGILHKICCENKKECIGLAVGTIKKFATGMGNASKDDMIDAASEFHLGIIDDNHADAIHIGLLGYSLITDTKKGG